MRTSNYSLTDLGFSAYFLSQLGLDELGHLLPMRIVEVQRDRLTALGENGPLEVALTADAPAGNIAVGDWILIDAEHSLVRLLVPKSSLRRRAAGTDASVQLIANNVDTLFIVTSCNADFNEARIERYLALSNEAEVTPVVLLTKTDLSNEVTELQAKAEKLMQYLSVVPLNATEPNVATKLEQWCGPGQTIALLGSSGVGKTTLLNALTGDSMETQGVREGDAKGRHTTTFRAMRPITQGGWVIDTPGMRALRLHDSEEGIDAVFDEIIQAASRCRFTDCSHETEPGCAVQKAISQGVLDVERLDRWRKLQREDRHNTQSIAQARKRDKQFGKMINEVVKTKQRDKGH
ncbi:MAG: ribosome small subunit-dependent GTPase A [Granulosicoccaceae bacterium]